MENTRPPHDLLRLRSATAAYLAIVRELEPLLEQVADVNRLHMPAWAELHAELRGALREHTMGTPASIGRALARLLGDL